MSSASRAARIVCAAAAVAGAVCAGNGRAAADGMYFRSVTAENAPIEATAQRAIMWQRDQVWEIHIQPIFSRGRGSGTWIVPFPVLPTVEPSSAAFFEQLEMLTAPVFVSYCETCPGSGGGEGGEAEIVDAGAYVRVWERGSVGDLDFTVISSADGESAVDWLVSQGYEVDSAGEALLTELEGEGAFFFVGKLSNTLETEKPLQPVRFILPGLYPPEYPLRLSSLGVSRDQSLKLTIWVVFPLEEGFVASSHDAAALTSSASTAEGFTAELEERLLGSDDLVLLFNGSIGRDSRFERMDSSELCHSGVGCFGLAELGMSPPQEWSPEIQEIRANESWVFRYEGWLSPAGLDRPLSFRSVPTSDLPSTEAFHVEFVGACSDCETGHQLKGCRAAGWFAGGSPTAPLFAIAALLVLAALAAMRSPRARRRGKPVKVVDGRR
jgi:hypothetical protein